MIEKASPVDVAYFVTIKIRWKHLHPFYSINNKSLLCLVSTNIVIIYIYNALAVSKLLTWKYMDQQCCCWCQQTLQKTTKINWHIASSLPVNNTIQIQNRRAWKWKSLTPKTPLIKISTKILLFLVTIKITIKCIEI
jgi:hypothetical protein